MVETITNAMLRKALNQATRGVTVNPTTNVNTNTNDTPEADTPTIKITTKKVDRAKGSTTLICKDGTHLPIYTLPGLYYKCLAPADEKTGISILSEELTALVLSVDDKNYCIGVRGATSDFEIRLHIAKNELRLNQEFFSLITEHLVVNGLEVKDDKK